MARLPASLLAAGAAAVMLAGTAPAYAVTPPTPVTALAARGGDGQVALTWTNPGDADFAGVTVVEKPGTTPPATTADGTTVYAGTAQQATATGLTNGTAYAFSVFTRNTGGDTSAPASVTATPVPAVATTLTASVDYGTVTYAHPIVLTGTLHRADNDDPVAGAPVDVYRKVYGATTFTKAFRVTTNSAGVATLTTVPATYTQWYLAHPGDPYLGVSFSATLATQVRMRVSYALSRAVAEQHSTPATLTSAVAPGHAGATLVLQRYTGSGWESVAWPTLDGHSHTTQSLATDVLGQRRFRFFKPGDAEHLAAYSPSFTFTVVPRTLRPGLSGPDVLALQHRLQALHYDPGVANGYFGFDTTHAVAAFQKVNRIAVTGVVDATTHARLASPLRPTLRYTHTGAWIEADLTKQVLYYVKDGAIARILDISSGSGKYFTVDGVTQKAVTPTGSFHVFHKIDGLRTSRLGELWRPAYFASGGYAIHGNGSVPYYPASHGCIRITIPAMNRLFALLTIGMPVHVYRS